MRIVLLMVAFLFYIVPLRSPDLFTDSLLDAEKEWGIKVGAIYELSAAKTSPTCGAGSVGMRFMGGNLIAVNPNCLWDNRLLNRRTLTDDFEHEIGHMLGLGHSSNYNSIMYWLSNGQPMSITPQDRAAVSQGSSGVDPANAPATSPPTSRDANPSGVEAKPSAPSEHKAK